MKSPAKGPLALLLALVAVLALSACQETEPGHPISFEKGTYQGPKDQALDPSTLKALRQRAGEQGRSSL